MPFVTFADRYERQKGKEEGELKGLLSGLEALLEVRFGVEGLALMDAARRIESPERLSALVGAVKSAPTLDDFRAALPPGT